MRDADWRKLVGAFIMFSFAGFALFRWSQTSVIFFLLLAFKNLVTAYYLAIRKETEVQTPLSMRILAYASSATALCYLKPTTTNPYFFLIAVLLSTVGFLLSTLATIELGDRMGVAPAKRGEICQTGVYRLTKHPMYLGYIIAELGNTLLNPMNIFVFLVSVFGYFIRSKKENRILSVNGSRIGREKAV